MTDYSETRKQGTTRIVCESYQTFMFTQFGLLCKEMFGYDNYLFVHVNLFYVYLFRLMLFNMGEYCLYLILLN